MAKELKEINKTPLECMSESLSIDPESLHNIIISTVMPNEGKGITNEQFVSFIAVANNYKLDPLKKEIYAFPAKGGGIQPIVSIDGWLGIINSHPDFDGMDHEETFDEKGNIFSVKCSIHIKGRSHPTVITEYLSECIRSTDPWKKKVRMLRHKATIQCARYAFGLSGIMEQDEAEAAIEKDITPKKSTLNLNKESYIEKMNRKPVDAVSQDNNILPAGPDIETLKELIDSCDSMDRLEAIGNTIAEHSFSSDERDQLIEYYRIAKNTIESWT